MKPNNYIKLTARASHFDAAQIRSDCSAYSHIQRPNSFDNKPVVNLVWFLHINDDDDSSIERAKADAANTVKDVSAKLGDRCLGFRTSVYRNFPGNTLPVIGEDSEC